MVEKYFLNLFSCYYVKKSIKKHVGHEVSRDCDSFWYHLVMMNEKNLSNTQ